MKDFGFLPLTFLTRYMMPIGSAMETVILSLALADRINILKKEKETSQAQALNEMKKNQQLIREQNIVLEQKVVERTAELEQTLMDLKQTQSQLVAAEKLASLGQLTAGIAHEINNPINFVSSNIEPLKNDIKDIIELFNIYQEKARSLNPAEFKSAKEFEDEIDLEYTIEEIDRLMKGIREGADRTTEIVSSLRTFSRTDEIALQTVDIHTIIDSTLTILKNNLGRIQVIRQYGEILPIEAYAGKLNQAIMNVVNNAMQAIFDCYEDESKGIIYIKTEQIDSMIKISISDNGSGIDPLYVDKIFEPFFTTKEVGKGTGLGLSITYGIIDQHSGKIYAEEHGNTGTKISIEIPIHQS
jgi:signal transduction histidine kinase